MITEDIEELFEKTLIGDYEDETPWEAVGALRRIGSREVFDRAAEWCKSNDPLVRARGIDVLAQLGKTVGHPSNNFPEEAYCVVSDLAQRETELRPLASAVAALGHLDNPSAIPLITRFATHSDSEIRFCVACALGSFPNDEGSAKMLLILTDDAAEDVRDWATFGLGVLGDLDSNEIRDALLRRLGDSNRDGREEAMTGLGKRRDERVLRSLVGALEMQAVSGRVIEADYLMLGMKSERDDWSAQDYAASLRERFGLTK